MGLASASASRQMKGHCPKWRCSEARGSRPALCLPQSAQRPHSGTQVPCATICDDGSGERPTRLPRRSRVANARNVTSLVGSVTKPDRQLDLRFGEPRLIQGLEQDAPAFFGECSESRVLGRLGRRDTP